MLPASNALEMVMEKLDRSDWPAFIAMARDYYHFWIKDIKAIAALNSEAAFDVDPIKWQPLETNLKVLWNMLDKEKFETSETWPIAVTTCSDAERCWAVAMLISSAGCMATPKIITLSHSSPEMLTKWWSNVTVLEQPATDPHDRSLSMRSPSEVPAVQTSPARLQYGSLTLKSPRLSRRSAFSSSPRSSIICRPA